MNRRSFINALMVIALAPRLCFKDKVERPTAAFWIQTQRATWQVDDEYLAKLRQFAAFTEKLLRDKPILISPEQAAAQSKFVNDFFRHERQR